MKMTKTTILARLETTNAQGHATMYLLSPPRYALPHTHVTVFLVPYHLRHCIYVRRHAFNRLVSSPLLFSVVSLDLPFAHRNVVSKHPITGPADPDSDVYIGRSEVAMWMRVVSSWVCMLLYMWSLMAPVFMPERWVGGSFSYGQVADSMRADLMTCDITLYFTDLDKPISLLAYLKGYYILHLTCNLPYGYAS